MRVLAAKFSQGWHGRVESVFLLVWLLGFWGGGSCLRGYWGVWGRINKKPQSLEQWG